MNQEKSTLTRKTKYSYFQGVQSAPHSLPGSDDITRAELDNGIVILARENFSSPSISISGYLTVGSVFESDEKLGIADFTASALMRGTTERDFHSIFDALESVGASLGFNSGTHTTGFGGRALVEDLDLLLKLLGETVRYPIFPLEEVERLRAQLLTGLAIRAQDTAEMATLAFNQIVYANHPYRRPEDGYTETIQAITREDMVDFHRTHFGPRGMVVAIVGAVQPWLAVEKIAAVLGDWSNPIQASSPELPALTPLDKLISQKVDIPGKSQADLVMGTAGPPRKSPDYMAASLGNSVLGQFGMMGRIGDVVREQAGLAYHASSSLSGGMGPGPWRVSAGVDPANVEAVIDLIRREIARFVSEPVAVDELADCQANYIGRLPLSFESNAGVAGALLNLERYQLGLDYYRNYADQVQAVSVGDVLEAARRYLHPDRLGIATAGPPSEVESW